MANERTPLLSDVQGAIKQAEPQLQKLARVYGAIQVGNTMLLHALQEF